ncbi:hypothetical protein [Candidatus Proelusimicrobium excrementi]|mgnify:FL=1|uniref:hypothetical protein n=1 Tax=Candidatus Proelusimicrobium excrementi TaxID=3416222 RepID=UPI003CAD090B|nr:hypothetical protein [Elusimicrobiaceae bacterium]
MKKSFLLLAVLCGAIFLGACSGNKKSDAYEEEPYNRSKKASYENQMRYSAFIPFMYEDKFYAYYALGKKISGPDNKGWYEAEFKNGPKEGQTIKTKDIILKTRPAEGYELKKGLVVLVNHWNPKKQDENSRTDMWRKGVVYNLDKLSEDKVMLEFPHDRNDFMATKEVYRLDNIRLILEPENIRDPRIFLD